MLVRNNHGHCYAPGGYYWSEPGSVVEVPNSLGNHLIRIGNDFEEVLPEETDTAVVDHLDRDEEPAGDDVPAGTANKVLEWVGTDPARAAAALLAEHARGEAARTSLVTKLEKLAP